jgi:hypothetical protein
MTVKIEDTEIRPQENFQNASGTSKADTKPLKIDIINLLSEQGYNAHYIAISFDESENIWRWHCGITKKVEAVSHPSHYGGKDNPYEVIKIIEAWGLDNNFMIGNAFKYIARAGKKDKAKEVEDLKKAAFYLDRQIRKLNTIGKPTLPIDGEIQTAYLLTNVQEGLKMEGLLKTSIYHIYKTLFCTNELNEIYTPDSKRLEIELHNLRLALQAVNSHIYKLELEAGKI